MNAAGDVSRFYRGVVLEHSQAPHNFAAMTHPDRHAGRHNALCGDSVEVFLRMTPDGQIDRATFQGSGCAISIASASLMTDLVRGLTAAAARALAEKLSSHLEAGTPWTTPEPALAAITGVRAYPARVRCALLPWQALQSALAPDPAPVGNGT